MAGIKESIDFLFSAGALSLRFRSLIGRNDGLTLWDHFNGFFISLYLLSLLRWVLGGGYEEETHYNDGKDCDNKYPSGVDLTESAHAAISSHVDVVGPWEIAQFTAGIAFLILKTKWLVVTVASNAKIGVRIKLLFVGAKWDDV